MSRILILLSLFLFPNGLLFAAEGVPTPVAVLGDSITAGDGLSDPATESYPAVLQALLGKDHDVRNFGVNAAPLLNNSDKPYRRQDEFDKAKAFRPEIVVILLGTNDSKGNNWRASRNFVKEYRELIAEIRSWNRGVRIVSSARHRLSNRMHGGFAAES